jgi:RES domain-containing protein
VTITTWRIVESRHLAGAFSGEGARAHPGRWNERGTPMVYTAASLSLAALEMLVHRGSADLLRLFMSIPVQFDDALCRRLPASALPSDWKAFPAAASTRTLGTAWIASAASPVLAVPSAVVPIETVFLLNPRHPEFPHIRIGDAADFQFDARFVKAT